MPTYQACHRLMWRCPILRAATGLCVMGCRTHTDTAGCFETVREVKERQREAQMRHPSRNVAANCILLLCHQGTYFATAFSSASTLVSSKTPSRTASRLTTPTMGPAPGLFPRKLPNGLGSWRLESVVDSEKPSSIFVFLFDDGSGEAWIVQVGSSENGGLFFAFKIEYLLTSR